MAKIKDCDRCFFYGKTSHIICAIHPYGVDGNSCFDFRPHPYAELEQEQWAPEGYYFYDGELFKQTTSKLTREQQLSILDTHPFFTHQCPQCGYEFDLKNPPAVHWDCPECGWVDDAIV